MSKKHIVYHSLLRSQTLFGAERVLFMLWSMFCVMTFILNISFMGAVFSLVLIFAGWSVIAFFTKLDPKFRQLYIKNVRYRRVYQATPFEHSGYRRKYNR